MVKAVKLLEQFPSPKAGTKRLCFGRSIQKFLNMSDKNSSLPKSGPPERWIVLAIADL
jgi:hypothetical protein